MCITLQVYESRHVRRGDSLRPDKITEMVAVYIKQTQHHKARQKDLKMTVKAKKAWICSVVDTWYQFQNASVPPAGNDMRLSVFLLYNYFIFELSCEGSIKVSIMSSCQILRQNVYLGPSNFSTCSKLRILVFLRAIKGESPNLSVQGCSSIFWVNLG